MSGFLHNRVNKEILKQRLHQEDFKRITISFYRYIHISDPPFFRDQLYREWSRLNCFGRVYVAAEGINAQMSIPEHHYHHFVNTLNRQKGLEGIKIRHAVEDDGKSFYKLTIKVKKHIVADGLQPEDYDVTDVGTHLTALEFHTLAGRNDTVVVDMRNHYETEVGHFNNAYLPESDTFREPLQQVGEELKAHRDKKILLYCTGGIRCEKASAYLKQKGYQDVNQLHGGIIEYAQKIRQLDLEPRFRGKNFVFDERMGEAISDEVIGRCHQCGEPCDRHVNCANDACHLLFIQCDACRRHFEGYCSYECFDAIHDSSGHQQGLAAKDSKSKGARGRISDRTAESWQLANGSWQK